MKLTGQKKNFVGQKSDKVVEGYLRNNLSNKMANAECLELMNSSEMESKKMKPSEHNNLLQESINKSSGATIVNAGANVYNITINDCTSGINIGQKQDIVPNSDMLQYNYYPCPPNYRAPKSYCQIDSMHRALPFFPDETVYRDNCYRHEDPRNSSSNDPVDLDSFHSPADTTSSSSILQTNCAPLALAFSQDPLWYDVPTKENADTQLIFENDFDFDYSLLHNIE